MIPSIEHSHYTIEKLCTSIEFQIWSECAASLPGYVTKGWALTDYWGNIGKGWVTFETENQAMFFKLSTSG